MPLSSLRLIIECERNGLLTKQAALQLLETREELIKAAMRKQAAILVESIRTAPDPGTDTKIAGLLSTIGDKAHDFGSAVKRTFKDVGLAGRREGSTPIGWGGVAGNLGKMLGLAGLTAGAAAGVGGIIRHSRDKKLRGQIEESAAQLYKENPQLNEYGATDKNKVMQRFGLLAKFAPSIAAEPSIAGAWIHSSMKQGPIGPNEIRNLAETQHQIDEMNHNRHKPPTSFGTLRAGDFASKALGGS